MSIAKAFSNATRHVAAYVARIVKPPRSRPPDEWHTRIERMRSCQDTEELMRDFGEPAHKVPQGGMEVWHYPLGVIGGYLYSVHAVASGHELKQVFMYFEPAEQYDSPSQLPRPGTALKGTAKSPETGAYFGDPELYSRICAGTPYQRQRAATAVARLAVDHVALNDEAVVSALASLASGAAVTPEVALAVKNLAGELERRWQSGGQQQPDFALARAADSVAYAISGDVARAAYEAFFATDDRPRVQKLVLNELAKSEGC